jgi:hypothetical protein
MPEPPAWRCQKIVRPRPAPPLMQGRPELAKECGYPECKIAERQRVVADASRHAGLAAAAKAGVKLGAGKLADVVVLVDGNPLEDLGAVVRGRMTFVGGRRMV